MKTLMRNGRDRRSENPLGATRGKSACFWLGPISGSHQGQQPQPAAAFKGRIHGCTRTLRKKSDSFPLHRGRRPYMAPTRIATAHRERRLIEVKLTDAKVLGTAVVDRNSRLQNQRCCR